MLKPTHAFIGVAASVLIAAACSDSGVQSAKTEAPAQDASAQAKPGPDGWAGAVRGIVTNLNGDPIEGAFVKLRNPERRLTVMVISKDEGSFIAGNLPSGSWEVQAVGGDLESRWSPPVAVSAMGTVEANIALTETRAPDLAPAWPRRVPEDQASLESLPAGHGKEIIQARCTSCHDTARIAANRADREGRP